MKQPWLERMREYDEIEREMNNSDVYGRQPPLVVTNGFEEEDRGRQGIDKEEQPNWVLQLIESKFYVPCTTHATRKPCHNFCTTCIASPFCDDCKMELHNGDRCHVLRVFKNTYHPSLRVEDIKDLLDVSDIHQFSINSYAVIFLRERPYKGNATKVYNIKCKHCGRGLSTESDQSPSAVFCSIGCKINRNSNLNKIINSNRGRSDPQSNGQLKRSRSRRKGIPRRAAGIPF